MNNKIFLFIILSCLSLYGMVDQEKTNIISSLNQLYQLAKEFKDLPLRDPAYDQPTTYIINMFGKLQNILPDHAKELTHYTKRSSTEFDIKQQLKSTIFSLKQLSPDLEKLFRTKSTAKLFSNLLDHTNAAFSGLAIKPFTDEMKKELSAYEFSKNPVKRKAISQSPSPKSSPKKTKPLLEGQAKMIKFLAPQSANANPQ